MAKRGTVQKMLTGGISTSSLSMNNMQGAVNYAKAHQGEDLDEEGIGSYMESGMSVLTDVAGVIGNKSKYKGASTGKAIGNAVGTGLGAAFGGPLGAKIGGAVLGTVGTLIGQGADNRRIDADEFDHDRKLYGKFQPGANIDMYGNTFEDGGAAGGPADEVPQDSPPKVTINVEKGELMIDPVTFKIVRKFNNPNRFSPHKDKQMDEAIGNFIQVDEGMVIIPKKLAPRYERGDALTRKSILLQVLSDQADDPMHNVPEEAIPEGYDEVEHAEKGGFMGIKKSHKGYCTPMTKSTCTPRRKALAKTLKKHHGFHEKGGEVEQFAGGGGTGDPIPLMMKSAQNPAPKPKLLFGFLNQPDPIDLLGVPEVYPTPDGKQPIMGATNPELNSSVFPRNATEPYQRGLSTTTSSTTEITDNGTAGGGTGSKRNWKAIGRQALQNLPIFAQMAQSLQGDPYLQHNPNIGFEDAISDAYQMPENVSVAGNIAANSRSFSTAIRGIDDNSTPSTRAEKSAVYGAKVNADSNVYGAQGGENTRLRSGKLAALLNLKVQQGADIARDNTNYMNEARMDKAARENMFNEGLNNYTNNTLQAQNDSERIKALNSVLKSIQIDPYAQSLIKENPGFGDYAVQYMLNGQGTIDDAYAEYIAGMKKKKVETTVTNNQRTNYKNQTSTSNTTKQKTTK